MKSRENIENQRFTTFSPALQLLKMVLRAAQGISFYFIFIFIFRKVILFMLLSDLLQVLNLSNFIGIHEITADGTSYDMIYTGQIKTRSELYKVIEKYGKRKVKEIDTSIDEGKLIYIELER